MQGKVTYHQQVSYCGKERCKKCREGVGHGPYWYAYQTIDGRTTRTYIGKKLTPEAQKVYDSQQAQETHEQHHASPLNNSASISNKVTVASKKSSNSTTELLQRVDAAVQREAFNEAISLLYPLITREPAHEAIAQRLIRILAHVQRRSEALQTYKRFADNWRRIHGKEPPSTMQALQRAMSRGETISLGIPLEIEAETSSSNKEASEKTSLSHPPALGEESRLPSAADNSQVPMVVRETVVTIGRTNQSPLVGRQQELATLYTMLQEAEQVRRSRSATTEVRPLALPLDTLRHPQCAVLLGEAGIGKTRLAEELSRKAQQQGWTILWGRVYSQESGIPYRLWTEVLRKAVLMTDNAPLSAKQKATSATNAQPSYMQQLATLLPELQASRQGQGAQLSAPQQNPLYLWMAARDLLVSVSEQTPLVIVLDDIQWADASSHEMLGYVARQIHDYPILLIATCREKEMSRTLRDLVDHMQREHTVKTLTVERLSNAEIGLLVSQLNVEETTVERIQTQSDGNPFFAEELARTTPPELPQTVEAALQHRMDRLSRPCYQLLEKASVLGGSFELDLICTMEAKGEGVALDLLDEALNAGVLTEDETGARITYYFWHPLLVSYLYSRLMAERRTRLHRQAADILQRMYSGHEDEVAATITQHLVQGGAETDRIAYYAELAAERAYALSAYPEAERHYRLALHYIHQALLEGGGDDLEYTEAIAVDLEQLPRLIYLLEHLAECTSVLGNFREARRLYGRVLWLRQALSVSKNQQPYEAQVQALLWGEIGRMWRYTGDSTRAHLCCERGMQVLRDAQVESGPAWARLHYQQGNFYQHEGRYDEALASVQKALTLFSQAAHQYGEGQATYAPSTRIHTTTRIQRTLQGDPVDAGRVQALLGALYDSIGRADEALSHLHTALSIYEQYDQKREIAHVSCNIGHLYVKMADKQAALSILNRSRSLIEQIGDRTLPPVIESNMAILSLLDHDQQEAEMLYKHALKQVEHFNDREYVSRWSADLALVYMEQAELEKGKEARLYLAHALRIARAMHNNPCLGWALVGLGNFYLAQAKSTPVTLPIMRTRLLQHGQHAITHALQLSGLEAETRIKGQLVHAQLLLLQGDSTLARTQLQQVLQEAQLAKLALVERTVHELHTL